MDNKIHFIYPVTELTRPLSYLNYQAVKRAYEIHNPDIIYFWTNLPDLTCEWGKKILPMVELMTVELPTEFNGIEVRHPQYMSDIMRLEILHSYGGIYMDTDMLLKKPLYEWMGDKLVMSWEPSDPLGQSVCNALMITPPYNPFISIWLNYIGDALKSPVWAECGVVLPAKLWKSHQFTARQFTEIIDPYFFCPFSLKSNYLFDPNMKDEARYLAKDSFAVHAFETFWAKQIVNVGPDWCKENDCYFTELVGT